MRWNLQCEKLVPFAEWVEVLRETISGIDGKDIYGYDCFTLAFLFHPLTMVAVSRSAFALFRP